MGTYTHTEELGETLQYDQKFNRICDGIGLSVYKRTDNKLVKKLQFVINQFSREAKSDNPILILTQFEKWTKAHGTSPSYRGEAIIDPVYQSLRLQQDRATLADRMAVEERLTSKIDEKQTRIDAKVAKEKERLEELKTQAASEKAERVKLEAQYKAQTGQDFDYNAAQGKEQYVTA